MLSRAICSGRQRRILHLIRQPLSAIHSSSSVDSYQLKKLNTKDWLSPNEVLKIFDGLREPSSVILALRRYSSRKDYKPNEALYTLWIDAFARGKLFDDVDAVMDRVRAEKGCCRLSEQFFYNVIKVYGNVAGHVNRAVQTLYDMPAVYGIWPSVKSFNFVLNLLVSWKLFEFVHEVYAKAPELGVEIDACCLNILVKGLCKSGNLDAALNLLDEFPKQRCKPNERTFSTLMHGLCKAGKLDDAFGLLERMEGEGIFPDTVTFNILIAGLRSQGRVDEGIRILERTMELKGCDPNEASYQEVLYGLIDKERYGEAKIHMVRMISKGMNPSFVSYRAMLSGLSRESSVDSLDWILNQMVKQGFIPRMGMWRQVVRALVSKHNHEKVVIEFEQVIDIESISCRPKPPAM